MNEKHFFVESAKHSDICDPIIFAPRRSAIEPIEIFSGAVPVSTHAVSWKDKHFCSDNIARYHTLNQQFSSEHMYLYLLLLFFNFRTSRANTTFRNNRQSIGYKSTVKATL